MAVIKSPQRYGKGTLVQIMKIIVGGYVGETSNPDAQIFGSHGNVHVKCWFHLMKSRVQTLIKYTEG